MKAAIAVARKENTSAFESLQTLNCDLSPIVAEDWVSLLTGNSRRIENLMEEHGSPLHLVAPEILLKNLKQMEGSIRRFGVKAQVYYAMKANKGRELVRAAASHGFGIDVASEHEFLLANNLGLPHTPISLSGPLKPTSLFQSAIERGALISIDSVEELRALRDHVMTNRSSTAAKVYLRYRPTFKQKTRFGMNSEEVMHCLRILVEFRPLIEFVGFHMHLSGYAAAERGRATEEVIRLSELFSAQGLKTRILNIGGGMPVQYVDPSAFETYLDLHQGCAIDYQGNVPRWFYPYGGRQTFDEWMSEYMHYFLAPGVKLSDWLRRSDITLAIEPGRSALDQVAISLFRVGLVKQRDNHSTLFLNGSSFSASEPWFQSDYLCDPILLRFGTRGRQLIKAPLAYYLAGHSCLEEDLIAHRPFSGEAAIVAGDVLAFINTAGYHMDLMENNFHHHPTPARLNVDFASLSFTRE